MIKMMKRIFFHAAFLLCAALAFAVKEESGDKPSTKVYDAKDTLVCELTEQADIEAFNNLLSESAAVAVDDAAFTQAPKNAKVAYRYEVAGVSSTAIRLLIYADSKTAYIPNAPKGDDMPEVFAWELFGEAYKILSQPASLKGTLTRYKDKDKTIFIYDAKGFLISSARIPSLLQIIFGNIMDEYAGDTDEHQFSGNPLPERSIHEGKQLLYRYTIWSVGDDAIRMYIYSDTDKAVLTSSFPYWADCTLSKEGYALFKNPKKLIEKLETTAIQLPDIR